MPWANRNVRTIPRRYRIDAQQGELEVNNYSLGMNSFLGNDLMPMQSGGDNYWRLAQDARITTFGQYSTRKGFDFINNVFPLPTGGATITSVTSTTGAADHNLGGTNWLAQPFTTTGAVRLAQVLLTFKNASSATGVPIVEIWTDSSGIPGAKITRSSADSGLITSSYQSSIIGFPDGPLLAASTKYWLVVYIQAGGTGNYSWRSTTTNTAGLTSVNSGASWSSNSFGFNFTAIGADNNGTIGLHQAVKSDGTTKIMYATGTQVDYLDSSTSSPTVVKSGLNAGATAYRFMTANDIVYYVNGKDGYRKWDFTTESQVNATNYSNICLHKGFSFLVDVLEPNKLVFSNFGLYETFTSTDFFDIPAPKTGDPITALISLNGYLLIFTRQSKYILSGSDNSTFQLTQAPDQKGTFSQETATTDGNYVYYLSDDGVYRSNGNQAQVISTNIYQEVVNITTKGNCCMAVNQGRLYMWYASSGSAANDSCYVWSLNYDSKSQTLESKDMNAYVSRAVTGLDTSFPLIVGSSVVGTAYYQELPSNSYNNLGGDINFYLQTHYMTLGSPSVLHEIRRWLSRFSAQSSNYAVTPLYAYDLRDNFQSAGDVNVQGSGAVWGSGIVWGAFTWGTTAEVQNNTYLPGEYRRWALAYKHYATRQPNTFLGHSIIFQTRKVR